MNIKEKKAALIKKLQNLIDAPENDLLDRIDAEYLPVTDLMALLKADEADEDLINDAYDNVDAIVPIITPNVEIHTVENELNLAGKKYGMFINQLGGLPKEVFVNLATLTCKYSNFANTHTVFFEGDKLIINVNQAARTTYDEDSSVTSNFISLRQAIIEYAEEFRSRNDMLSFAMLGVLFRTLNNLDPNVCNQRNAADFAGYLQHFRPSRRNEDDHNQEVIEEDLAITASLQVTATIESVAEHDIEEIAPETETNMRMIIEELVVEANPSHGYVIDEEALALARVLRAAMNNTIALALAPVATNSEEDEELSAAIKLSLQEDGLENSKDNVVTEHAEFGTGVTPTPTIVATASPSLIKVAEEHPWYYYAVLIMLAGLLSPSDNSIPEGHPTKE